MLEIGSAFRHPVRFEGQEYIRVGTYKKKLKDFPEKERDLWRVFDEIPFEDMIAAENISTDEVLRLLEYNAYFELLRQPIPIDNQDILNSLVADEIVKKADGGSLAHYEFRCTFICAKVNRFSIFEA